MTTAVRLGSVFRARFDGTCALCAGRIAADDEDEDKQWIAAVHDEDGETAGYACAYYHDPDVRGDGSPEVAK